MTKIAAAIALFAWAVGSRAAEQTATTPPDPCVAIEGVVEGQPVSPEFLTSAMRARGATRRTWRHTRLPLEIEAECEMHGTTRVFTHRLTLVNRGDRPLRVERMPSLAWRLPKGEYTLTYLYGGWGQERQVATERLTTGRRAFVSDRGRSTSLYSPWFYLHNQTTGRGYLAQLAWSGNWEMAFERRPGTGHSPLTDQPLAVSLGMRFDFGGALTLAPGERFELPAAAFTLAGDLDDAANRMHRYQREFVIPRQAANDPPLVQFNSWYPFPGQPTAADLKRCADVAKQLGAEVFVLDSGWYNRGDWSKELGDYQVDRTKFPGGLEEVSNYVHGIGLKFGLWVEIENAGVESTLAREHPGWFLQFNGEPIRKDNRYQLNFAKPEVRAWAAATLDRLVRDYRLDWVKIDYNIDIGEAFDPSGADRPGDVLYRHVLGYYRWLDELRARHPGLIVENCSSGGLRFDLGILAHTHSTWLSDIVEPVASLQLGYGCTLEFTPGVCNHWMVGDRDDGRVDASKPPAWWDFLFRVPMNGQFGVSSRVFDWPPALVKRAAENIVLYKRLRSTIAAADVYHLTPPPPHRDPIGWMAIEYAAPEGGRSIVMAYRLGRSEPSAVFKPRGLDPDRDYRVLVDGTDRMRATGRTLARDGISVSLDSEGRSAVVEIQGAQ